MHTTGNSQCVNKLNCEKPVHNHIRYCHSVIDTCQWYATAKQLTVIIGKHCLNKKDTPPLVVDYDGRHILSL